MTEYLSNLRFRQGVLLFNALVRGKFLNQRPWNLAPKPRSIALLWGGNAFRHLEPFRRNSLVWRTDGRTDGQNRCFLATARP